MVDITKTKLIVRRGHSSDLPGLPKKQQPARWTPALDQGELAFAEDTGEIFIGQDPALNDKYGKRLEYPYRNVEIIGENSVGGFSRIHGEAMRDGASSDYYSGPMFTTGTPIEEQEVLNDLVDRMAGYRKMGAESSTPYLETEGSAGTRDVYANVTTLVANGDGSLTAPHRTLVVLDYSRNRMVYNTHGTDGTVDVHTIEIRDAYGALISSFAIPALSNSDPVFVPSAIASNGNIVGVVSHESGLKTIGVYTPAGSPLLIFQVTDGSYDSETNTTQLIEGVSVSGPLTFTQGLNSINGTNYLYFGDMLSVATNEGYIVAASRDNYFVLDVNGSLIHTIPMVSGQNDTPVVQWVRNGARIGARHENSSYFQEINPATGTYVNYDYAPSLHQALGAYGVVGDMVVDYMTVANGNYILFGHVPVASPVQGRHYCVKSIGGVENFASTFVADTAPTGLDDTKWRSPQTNLLVSSDRILENRIEWMSDFGFHEFTNSGVKTALWTETSVSSPNLTSVGFDSASDRIVGWDGKTAQVELSNNSTPADTEYRIELHGDNFYLGGDEQGSGLMVVSSLGGEHQYVVNIADKRYLGVYGIEDGVCVASVDMLTQTGQLAGGSYVHCGDNRIAVPLQDGRLLVLTVNSIGEVDWFVREAISASGGNFGERGLYFYSTATGCLVTLGGPTDSNTGRTSYAYSIGNDSISWSANITGAHDFACGVSYPVEGNYFGYVDRTGYAVVVNLLNGTSPYRGLADGAGQVAPQSAGSWAWDSTSMVFVYMNTTDEFTNQPTGGYIGDFVATSTVPYHGNSVNGYVDIVKIAFTLSGAGDWSSSVSRPVKNDRHEFLPPEQSIWADWDNGFIYAVSNGSIKCYNGHTLQLMTRVAHPLGDTFMKLTGHQGRLYFQTATHNGLSTVQHGVAHFGDADIHRPHVGARRLYVPVETISAFGREAETTYPWRTLLIDGDPERPYEFHDITALNAFIDYAVYGRDGQVVREGQHQLQYYHNPVSIEGEIAGDAAPFHTDMASVHRIDHAPHLPRTNIDGEYLYDERYDPANELPRIQFRYIVLEHAGDPVVRIQYRNRTSDDLSIRWKVSRPDIPVGATSQRGMISRVVGFVASLTGAHEAPPPPVELDEFESLNVDSFHLPEYDSPRYQWDGSGGGGGEGLNFIISDLIDLSREEIVREIVDITIGGDYDQFELWIQENHDYYTTSEQLHLEVMSIANTLIETLSVAIDMNITLIAQYADTLLDNDDAEGLAWVLTALWEYDYYASEYLGLGSEEEDVWHRPSEVSTPVPHMARLAKLQMFGGEPAHSGVLSIFKARANNGQIANFENVFSSDDNEYFDYYWDY